MQYKTRSRFRNKPSKKPSSQDAGQRILGPSKPLTISRRALEKSGFPENLDREIEELDRTEKLLARHFPEVFGD